MFTGNRDIDYKIMMDLDDRSLLNFCQANKKISKLCENDAFWRQRYESRFGYKEKPVNIPGKTSWRNHYLYRISNDTRTIRIGHGVTIDVTIDRDSPYVNDIMDETGLTRQQAIDEIADDMTMEIDIDQITRSIIRHRLMSPLRSPRYSPQLPRLGSESPPLSPTLPLSPSLSPHSPLKSRELAPLPSAPLPGYESLQERLNKPLYSKRK